MKIIPFTYLPPPPRVVYLPWWQTPDFCMKNLDDLYEFEKIAGNHTGTLARSHVRDQIKRYEAIAQERDWNEKRNAELIWLQPEHDEEVLLMQIKAYPDWRETLGDKMLLRPKKKRNS